MGRERIQEQIVAKGLRNQEWTFDERIVMRQILIVPDPFPLQSGRMHQNRRRREKDEMKPTRVK
jgi:hypothetical protein